MTQADNPPLLSIVIPTRDRRETLVETLGRIAADATGESIEVIVVDDGSEDGSAGAAIGLGMAHPLAVRVLDRSGKPSTGPAAARNRGIEAATGSACLLLDDDVQPRQGTIGRHLSFHLEHPDPADALLGRVVPAPAVDSLFSRWAHEHGPQFSYASLSPLKAVPPTSFWTAQVSVKTELLRRAGGFDESFQSPLFEDVELALRLDRDGMKLSYDPDAVAEHTQPIDIDYALARARRSGPQFRALAERAPDVRLPRRPGWRHRLKAGTLGALHLIGVRTPIRKAEWRFVVDEAQREALWERNADGPIRIGTRIERRLRG